MSVTCTVRESDFNELMDAVKRLMDSSVATRVVRKAVIAGLKPIGQAQKAVIRVKTGRLKSATGRPVFSRGTGRAKSQQIARGVVGINTGTKNKPGSRAHHGALWALGTMPRWTGRKRRMPKVAGGGRYGAPTGDKIAYRGFTHPNRVIRSTSISAAPRGIEAMKQVLQAELGKITEAARKKSTTT